MKSKIIIFLCFLSLLVQSKTMYSNNDIECNVFSVKLSTNKVESFEIGSIHDNHIYDGIQFMLPLFGKMLINPVIMNVTMGYGDKLFDNSSFVVAPILGVYIKPTDNKMYANYGGQIMVLTNNVNFGFTYTNMEKLNLKIGFYIKDR